MTPQKKNIFQRINILQLLAVGYLGKIKSVPYDSDGTPYLLEEKEYRKMRMLHRKTVALSMLFGAISILVLFIPKYIWPDLFPTSVFRVPFVETEVVFNVRFFLYGLVLAYIELYMIYFYNLKAIREMAVICRYPHHSNPAFQDEIEVLAETGIEKNRKFGMEYGLYPYQGLPKYALYLFFVLNFFKAALSNHIARFLVRRIGGRTLARQFVDMLGIPIFAFWNAVATDTVLKQARVKIYSPPLILEFSQKLALQYKTQEAFKTLVYDTLQYISILTRKYNYNHALLAKSLLHAFEIKPAKKHPLPENYFSRLREADPMVRKGIEKVIIFGVILDGKVSNRELYLLHKLHKENVLSMRIQDIREINNQYRKGKGIGVLMDF